MLMNRFGTILAWASVCWQASGEELGAYFVPPLEHILVTTDVSLPTTLSSMTATSFGNGDVLIVGGCKDSSKNFGDSCSSVSAETWIFSPESDSLVAGPQMPTARFNHASTMRGNNLYVFGGKGQGGAFVTQIDVLDMNTRNWNTLENVTDGISGGVAFTLQDIVYFTSGLTQAGELNKVMYSLDASNTFSQQETSIPNPRTEAVAQTISNLNQVFLVGGMDKSGTSVSAVNMFDGSKWETVFEDEELAHGASTATVLGDKLYLFGGLSHLESTGQLSGRITIFNPETDVWHHGGELAERTIEMAAAAAGNSIFLFGGLEGTNTTSPLTSTKKIQAYVQRAGLYESPVITLHGSGTTNPEYFFYEIMNNFETMSRLPLKMTYRGVGSSTGIAEFVGDARSAYLPVNQFGSGDIPLKKKDFDLLESKGHAVAQIPFTFGAVNFYVNIPEQRQGGRVEELVLSGCDVARIYSGKYKKWSDLSSGNPWLSGVDKDILTVHRKLGSSSTTGATEFLEKSCPEDWTAGSGSTINWPCDDAANNCKSATRQGSGGVQAYLDENEYSIGYLSVSHGFPVHLQPVTLLNANRKAVKPTSEAIQAAGEAYKGWPSSAFESFHDVSLINAEGDGSWPIVLISYVFVRKDISGMGSSGALLVAFLEYVLGKKDPNNSESAAKGQDLLPHYDFVSPPDSVLQLGRDALTQLTKPVGVPPFSLEESTTKLVGQEPYVLSLKRSNYNKVYQSSVNDGIDGLNERVAELRTSLNTMSAKIGDNGDDDDNTRAIAIAALVFAILNLLILLFVLRVLVSLRYTARKALQTSKSATRSPPAERNDSFHNDASRDDSEVSQSAAVQVQLV